MKTIRTTTPEQMLVRLETLCSRSEQCEYELREKMRRKGLAPADIESVLESLRSRRYVDDMRFAHAYVRDKYRFSAWGRRKIELGLRAKRIDAAIIREALSEIESEVYAENLRHILLRKVASSSDAGTYEGRTKVFRHAVSRGYEPDMVSTELRRILKNKSALSDDNG